MLKRLIVYAITIVVVVGGALYYLSYFPDTRFSSPNDFQQNNTPPKPWKVSEDHAQSANADFSVIDAMPDLPRWAGTNTGTDWPQFNGKNRDNRAEDTGLLASWPAEGPRLLWAAKGLGKGYSSVCLSEGVIYTMGNKGESEAILALDAGNGEKLWSTPFAAASTPSMGDGPRCTPAVSGPFVLGMGANGHLICADKKSGKIQWEQNVFQEYKSLVPGWGVCESVLIDGDQVIVTPGGESASVVSLHRETGKLKWKTKISANDRASYASAVVGEVAGVKQIIQFTSSGTVGLNAENGTFLWRDDSAANPTANCSSPLISGNFVFSASNYGTGGSLVKLTASGQQVTAELVYHTDKMKCHHGDMVIVDGLLFGSDDPGVLTCLELATGELKWKNRSVGKGSLTYADGKLYLRSETGPVALVEATGTGYNELGQFEPPHRSSASAWSHPVVASGRLYLRDQDVLLCYDLKN